MTNASSYENISVQKKSQKFPPILRQEVGHKAAPLSLFADGSSYVDPRDRLIRLDAQERTVRRAPAAPSPRCGASASARSKLN